MDNTFTLSPGDTIGVFAPSSYVEQIDIEASAALLEARGYKVFIHPQTYMRLRDTQIAGTTSQKISALYELYENKDIKAVWAAGGGNRALNLLDDIDYGRLMAQPKPLIGFSDTTALLNAITAHTGIRTVHGPVFKSLHSLEAHYVDQCLALLSGEAQSISLSGATVINHGAATGMLTGGCLSVFQYLAGTKDCPDLKGALLVLEDTGDHISRFERMFTHLQRQGVFQHIGGLILGEFHDLQDGTRPFGISVENIAEEVSEKHDIPVLINAPFGHGHAQSSLPIGAVLTLDTQDLKLSR